MNNSGSATGPTTQRISEVEQTIKNSAVIASQLQNAVIELRKRLAHVLTPVGPAAAAPDGRGNSGSPPRPMKSPLSDRVDEITSMNQSTLECVMATLNELAL